MVTAACSAKTGALLSRWPCVTAHVNAREAVPASMPGAGPGGPNEWLHLSFLQLVLWQLGDPAQSESQPPHLGPYS